MKGGMIGYAVFTELELIEIKGNRLNFIAGKKVELESSTLYKGLKI